MDKLTKMEKIKSLFLIIEKEKEVGKASLNSAIEQAAISLNLKKESARNYYYKSLKFLRQNPIVASNLGIDLKKFDKKSFEKFDKERKEHIYSVISKVLDGSGDALNIIVNSNDTNKNMSDIKVPTGYDKVAKPQKFDVFEFNDSFASNKEDKSNADDIFLQNKAFLENLEKANLKPNVDNIVNSNVKTPAQLELINKNDIDFDT